MKLVDGPLLRLGPSAKVGLPISNGWMAAMLGAGGPPSKAHDAEVTCERHGIRWRFRVWWRGADAPLWYSPNYQEVSLVEYASIWIRAAFAARRRRGDAPRARVVSPGDRS